MKERQLIGEVKATPFDEEQKNVKPGRSATPTVEELIEFLDKEEIPSNDGSLDLFDGIKKQVYPRLDINVFDDAQRIRQNRDNNKPIGRR